MGSASAEPESPAAKDGCVYLAYGLRIRSSLPLPGPVLEGHRADVELRTGPVRPALAPAEASDYWFRVVGSDILIHSELAGACLVQGRTHVVVDPRPGVGEALLQSFLLGPVLAFLLHQRGLLVLHASAVRMRDTAVAFVGAPGEGKSTLAAALYSRGHVVIADDLVAVEVDGRQPMVCPGFPLLRLCRDAWERYAGSAAAWRPVDGDDDKAVWATPERFRPERLPLQRVYLLEEGDREAVDPVRSSHATAELALQTFAGRRQAEAARAHLQQCKALAGSGVVRRLQRRRAAVALEEVVRLVENDVARSG